MIPIAFANGASRAVYQPLTGEKVAHQVSGDVLVTLVLWGHLWVRRGVATGARQGRPHAGRGIDGSLLGTTQRTDGTVRVTYNDHPLYFYAHEGKREVKCHDIFLNGGNWYVIQPGGDSAPPG